MTLDQQISWLFRINAAINWTLALRGIFAPESWATFFGGPVPNYPFIVRLWSAFVFMFGCMFWEVSRDMRVKAALIKYNWIEKTITALAVTLGYFAGQAPARLMILIVLTNWLWIPFLFYYDLALRRAMRTAGASPA
jgi:hypothetical protein